MSRRRNVCEFDNDKKKDKKKDKFKDECCCDKINIVNDNDREVAIGKVGVAAGEYANVAVVGDNGAAAAGSEPEAEAFTKEFED